MAPRREQGIYRRVTVRMWGDAKVMALSRPQPCGQVLWIHLLAGEQTDIIPGLCKIGEAAFAEQLGWTMEGFREAFREVFQQGMAKADWKARVVWVPKAIEHNAPASPNVVLSWSSAWDRIPECELKTEAWIALRDFLGTASKPFVDAFLEACPKPSGKPSEKPLPKSSGKAIDNQEQDQEQEQEQEQDHTHCLVVEADASDDAGPFERVEAVWNRVCVPVGFAKSRSTPQQRKAARARLREPGWFEAFELACSHMAADPFYRGGGNRGWIATLGWLLKPGNAEKTAERAATKTAAPQRDLAMAPAESGRTETRRITL